MANPESAFPVYEHVEFESGAHALELSDPGMTLRDYFAAKALTGILANNEAFPNQNEAEGFAEVAYAMADAMLVQRGRDK